jgi:hypothetical protein
MLIIGISKPVLWGRDIFMVHGFGTQDLTEGGEIFWFVILKKSTHFM